MNNEAQPKFNTQNPQDRQNDVIHGPSTYIAFEDSGSDLDESREDVVSVLRRNNRSRAGLDGENDGSDDEERANRSDTTGVPSNPATTYLQRTRLLHEPRLNLQRATDQMASTSANPPQALPPPQRSSTPIENLQLPHQINMDDLANQLQAVGLRDPVPALDNLPPEYLPPNEQIKKIHNLELHESKQQVQHANQLSRLMTFLVNDASPQPLKAFKLEVDQAAERAKQILKNKTDKLAAANKIVEFYKCPINKPLYREPPQEYKKTFHRTSPKEITSLTGLFDPKNPNTDFSHVWSKLLGYGQANYFEEFEYMDALRYILQGDAYDTFLSFEQSNETLTNIIEYFGKIYTPKRSLNVHRHEVDHFVRKKDESLEIAMLRCLVAIDRLKILYLPQNWPEARINLRRNILTQIITEDTRRYIRMEEDDILEKHGLPIDLDALILMAHKYEIQYNKAPKTEVSTLFQVASGGLSEDPHKLKAELKYLKRETFNEKNQRLHQSDLSVAPVMTKRFSSDKDRESRRSSRDDDRHSKRQSRFDQNRGVTPEPSLSPAPPASSSRPPPTRMDTSSPSLERAIVKYDPRVQSPSYRPQSQERSYTPNPDLYRRQDSQGQRNTARDGRNSRFPSQDRYRESRSRPSDSSNRNTPQIYPPRQDPPRTQNRPYSSDRNQRSEQQRLPDRRPSYTPDRYERSYSSDRNQRPPDRNRSYSRDRNPTWSRDNRDQERNRNRSYSRDRYSNYNQGRSREPSYDRNRNSDMERQRYQQSVYDRNQRNQDRDRERDRPREIRYRSDPNKPPYRSPSPYPVELRNRRDQRDGYTPRSTSLTRYEDISPTAKMLTVNVNGSKFDRPSLKN